VDVLTQEGPEQVMRLEALGARFDRMDNGEWALGKEAAHSRRRILHARGDSTGAEVLRALVAAVNATPTITVIDHAFAIDLWVSNGRVHGLWIALEDAVPLLLRSQAIVLATGGIGSIFRYTTNPPGTNGDGLAIAARAGAALADLEFVQFHPTALATGQDPLPLLTEALRGEGAILIDDLGERFMPALHEAAELAPRDVVARAIWQRQRAGRKVFLDARGIGDRFPERFPTVWGLCQEAGIEPRQAPIAVSPAAHYHMGGIAVDTNGAASLKGLWACGEVSATGIHGANRLASNSLLEGLVFGARVAKDIGRDVRPSAPSTLHPLPRLGGLDLRPEEEAIYAHIREMMWQHAGLVRSAEGLQEALGVVASRQSAFAVGAPPSLTLRNVVSVAKLVCTAALMRKESRGGHFRADFPEAAPETKRHRFVAVGAC